jgi:ribulose-phosphate 3-epimerase
MDLRKQDDVEAGRVQIAPSLLSANFACLREDIKQVEAAGCRILHLDVMDGHFVPNLTIGPVVVRAVRAVTDLSLGAHLMIEEPGRYLEAFAAAGVNEITIHQEIRSDFVEVIKEIKKLGLRAGISIRPKTEVSVIEPALRYLDLILIMSVEPGFGGQCFIPGSEKKIEEARIISDRKKPGITIAVDGGITAETAPLAVRAGATELITGSAVFNGNIVRNIVALQESIRREE